MIEVDSVFGFVSEVELVIGESASSLVDDSGIGAGWMVGGSSEPKRVLR